VSRNSPTHKTVPMHPAIEAHTHHAAGSAGSECVACHMPKIEQTIADVDARAHTFKFITPAESEAKCLRTVGATVAGSPRQPAPPWVRRAECVWLPQ
jgi:hypothetical protein